MTPASEIVLSPEHAKRERLAAQSAVLAAAEEHGRVLFEAGIVGTDPLDRAAVTLFKALLLEREMRGWR